MQSEKKKPLNTKIRDSGSKLIFSDNALCAQFLRDYIDLPYVKEVKPEDIEDISEQFVPLFAEERNADRVKKVYVQSKIPFFYVSLIEHKAKVDYNVVMQIFRYMVYIWDSYEKEMEKLHPGIRKTAGFQYPPVIPIVYYEGRQAWSAPTNFQSRIMQGEAFGEYVPNFHYYLVPLNDYSNEDLLKRGDEISLIMLINKLQTKEDVSAFRNLSAQRLNEILAATPEYQLDLIANILRAFLTRENVSVDETEALVGKVKERKMAELFEDMEPMDIQAERKNTQKQRERAENAEKELQKAREAAVRLFIEGCQELGVSKENVAVKVKDKFSLDAKNTEEKLKLYWRHTDGRD